MYVCVCDSSPSGFVLTRKSMPTVDMKLPARKAPSLKRTNRQVFPTPESPTSITWKAGKEGQTQPEIGRAHV